MFQPNYEKAMSFQPRYTVVPVCREIYADIITPITLLRKIAAASKQYYLLESVENGNQWGRYSFLGFDPVITVHCKDGTVTLKGELNKTVKTQKPMEVLRDVLKLYKTPHIPDIPPFTGGFVGHFSYEMIGYAEPVLNLKKSDYNDFDLMLFDKVIAYDHLKQKICVVVNMKIHDGQKGYENACKEIDAIIQQITDNTPVPSESSDEAPEFTCNLTQEEYCKIVEKTKEYIINGDIFQAVLSRRFEAPYHSSLLNVYRVLRTTNPSPYMFFMKMDNLEYAGTSPETLIRLKDGRLSTFPVAGTRKRGDTYEEDKALETELLADEKELAEHNMLVDLARNDLGRISKFSTVTVEEYMQIHRFSKVMHIASTVSGDIREDKDAFDAIETMLPAGTLSGAPKIRACQIIDELEPAARGIYGGAVGYVDFSGNMDTCIAIRMATKKDGIVYVQAGGGIVADSIPENEYVESANKAGAIIQAIQTAGEVNN